MSSNKLLTVPEQTRSQKPGPPLTRTELYLGVGVLATTLLAVWVSQLIEPLPAVRSVAQFVHLSCVVVGLGSVMVVDWFGIRWQVGRTSMESVVAIAGAVTIPVWFGLSGLLLSGMFLEPDMSATLTQVKMGMVLVAGLIGVAALATQRLLTAAHPVRPPGLVRLGLTLAVTSQVTWWTAAVIGFLNRS